MCILTTSVVYYDFIVKSFSPKFFISITISSLFPPSVKELISIYFFALLYSANFLGILLDLSSIYAIICIVLI